MTASVSLVLDTRACCLEHLHLAPTVGVDNYFVELALISKKSGAYRSRDPRVNPR